MWIPRTFIWCEPRAGIYLLGWTHQILYIRATWPFAGRGPSRTLYTRKNLRLNSASCTVSGRFVLSESTTVGKCWFCLLTNGLRHALSSQNYANYILVCIYTDQSELHDLDQFGNLIHMKPAKMGTLKGDLVFLLAKHTFGFCPSLCLLGLQTVPCSNAFWIC